MTRAEAKAAGLRYYDPGRSCKYGHVGLWLTARRRCRECNSLENAKPKNIAARARHEATAAGREQRGQAKARYRQSAHGKEAARAFKDHYRDRENELAKVRAQDPTFKAKHATRQKARRAALIPRMHLSHREIITELYEAARLLDLTVDHIVPLYSDAVWGLHAPQNLQLLIREENSRKLNRLGPG